MADKKKPATVGELKRALAELDDGLPVYIWNGDRGVEVPIEGVAAETLSEGGRERMAAVIR